MNPPTTSEPRRRVLNYLLGSGAVATVGAILYPIFRFMVPPQVTESAASSVVAARVPEIKPNEGKISLPDDDALTFHAICTHLDCTVQYRTEESMIWCACHNGRYDLTGKNISGPPPRPLEEFTVNVRGDEIIVSRG